MSKNEDQQSEALENLEQMLLGSLNSNQDGEGNEFNRLQEMLVDPELLKMRDRVLKVEQKLPELIQLSEQVKQLGENSEEILSLKNQVKNLEKEFQQFEGKFHDSKDMIKIILPIVSKIMNRQLNQFKEEIIQAIVPLIEQHQQNQRSLSIRVVGLNPENQDELNN